MFRTASFAATAAFVISSIVSVPTAASSPLSAPALNKLFPGTFSVSYDGSDAIFTAKADGELVGRSLAAADTGRWKIKGAKLCITLDTWFDGKTRCSDVEKAGDWYRAESVSFRKL